MAIKNINTDLQVEAGLRDGDGDLGTNNQILISTGTGINWVDGSGSGIIGGPYLPLSGGGMTGTLVIGSQQLKFSDAGRLFMGDSNDLQIYHDGSNSYVSDTGTGSLILTGTDLQLKSAGDEFFMYGAADGQVALYHNGIKKFETGSTGVTVVGSATATTFLGDLNGTINTATTAVTKTNATDDTTVATTAFVQNLIGTIPAGLVFQGTWNAATNSPTLASGTGTTGHFYIVSTDGSTNLDGITDWKVGDWAVFVEQGATDAWEKVDNSSVLDGSGTGNQITKWAGSGTSNTLTDSIITDNGTNVGIGTASPNFKLDVNGDIRIEEKHWLMFGGVGATDPNWLLQNTQAADLSISEGMSGVRFFIENGGNVGIGTTTPSQKLDVAGNISVYNSYAAGVSLFLNHSDTYSSSIIKSIRDTIDQQDAGSSMLRFYTNDNSTTSPTVALDLTSESNAIFYGKVGIGTTSPDSLLEISSDSVTDFLKLTTTGGGATPIKLIFEKTTSEQGIIEYNRNGDLEIYNTDADGGVMIDGSASEGADLYVANNGNVGIGTASPARKLQVSYSSTTAPGFSIKNTNTTVDNNVVMAFNRDNSNSLGWTQGIDSGDNSFKISEDGDNLETNPRIVILSGGNVGIGTTSPGQKLDVSGNIRTNSNLYVYNSDLSKQALRVKAEATTNTGIFKLSNGSNWGLLMRGESNNPYIGSYFGGNLSITGFEDSTGTSPSAIKLAQFVFGGTGGGSGYLNLNGDLRVNTNKKIKFQYANSQENGIEWIAGSKISAAITPVDTANFSRAGLGFFTGDFSDGTTNADERMRITRAGNVGIGTTSPDYKLQVENTGNAEIHAQRLSGAGVLIQAQAAAGVIGTTTNHDLDIKTNGSTKIKIENTGNVGIGTTSPSTKLHVLGESIRTGVDISNYVDISSTSTSTSFSTVGNGIIAPDIIFNINTTNRLTIDGTTGNVGIGTASPEQRLHISSSGSTLMRITGGGSSIAGIDFGDSTNTDDGRIRYDNSSRYMQFVVADSERMRITSAGDTGIGVTTPRAKLDVAGGVKVADDTDSASANKVGTLRYRYVPGSPKNYSYVDMCMQTGASSYAWVNIVQNVWN